MTAKNQPDLVCLEKERAYGDHRASYHLMNASRILLVIMTTLLLVSAAQAASPLTMTPEIESIIGPAGMSSSHLLIHRMSSRIAQKDVGHQRTRPGTRLWRLASLWCSVSRGLATPTT